MEGLRIEADYRGTSIKHEARGGYDTGKSGASKTFHGGPHSGTKLGLNKGRIYTSTYAPGSYRNTTSEI